jgi:hypothetical protein
MDFILARALRTHCRTRGSEGFGSLEDATSWVGLVVENKQDNTTREVTMSSKSPLYKRMQRTIDNAICAPVSHTPL